jgi:hypothetical protein
MRCTIVSDPFTLPSKGPFCCMRSQGAGRKDGMSFAFHRAVICKLVIICNW